jgi:hypothetical protein
MLACARQAREQLGLVGEVIARQAVDKLGDAGRPSAPAGPYRDLIDGQTGLGPR